MLKISLLGQNKRIISLIIGVLLLTTTVSLLLVAAKTKKQNQTVKHVATGIVTPAVTPTTIPTDPPTPTPTASPSATLTPSKPISNPIATKILFSIGSQAGPAMDYKIVKEAPVHMLTSWYNGPKDLEWMRVQQNDLIPRLYTNNYVVHLITWTDLPEEIIQTPHGPACGRPYPVSTQVVEDMKQLAQIYNGPGPMYVSLFTEFQTYTCTDNNWIGNENYWMTLKDNYRAILANFHTFAPRSKVSLSWGGWQSRYDDQVNKGGRSLFPYFADVMRESDFTSFQAMESDSNVSEIEDMTRILGAYRRPVMLAHYKPSSGSSAVFDADMKQLFTDPVMQQLRQNGLFAVSFMDNEMLSKSESSYQLVKNGIRMFGK